MKAKYYESRRSKFGETYTLNVKDKDNRSIVKALVIAEKATSTEYKAIRINGEGIPGIVFVAKDISCEKAGLLIFTGLKNRS